MSNTFQKIKKYITTLATVLTTTIKDTMMYYIFLDQANPGGMTKQYAHTTRAPALSLPTWWGGLIYSLRWHMEDHDRA